MPDKGYTTFKRVLNGVSGKTTTKYEVSFDEKGLVCTKISIILPKDSPYCTITLKIGGRIFSEIDSDYVKICGVETDEGSEGIEYDISSFNIPEGTKDVFVYVSSDHPLPDSNLYYRPILYLEKGERLKNYDTQIIKEKTVKYIGMGSILHIGVAAPLKRLVLPDQYIVFSEKMCLEDFNMRVNGDGFLNNYLHKTKHDNVFVLKGVPSTFIHLRDIEMYFKNKHPKVTILGANNNRAIFYNDTFYLSYSINH